MASAPVALPDLPAEVLPESESLYEIVNGERREKPAKSALAGLLTSVLAHYLGLFALEHKLGLVGVEILFRLGPARSQRRPVVAFVAYDRWRTPAVPPEDPPAWEVVPNLVVEAVGPTSTAEEVVDRIQEYFDAGVQLVWILYPRHRLIYVYESPMRIRILSETDEIEGGGVLPGFRMSIATLFTILVRPQ